MTSYKKHQPKSELLETSRQLKTMWRTSWEVMNVDRINIYQINTYSNIIYKINTLDQKVKYT